MRKRAVRKDLSTETLQSRLQEAESTLRAIYNGVKYSPVSRHYPVVFKIEPSLPLTFRPAIIF